MKPVFIRPALLSFSLISMLAACASEPPAPDYRIKLVDDPSGKGMVAVPPECPSWHSVAGSWNENHPWPQYGCANARNLAAQVETAEDLADAKDMGTADAVFSAASIQNYRAGRTKPLIDPNATSPTASTPTGAGAAPK